VVLKVDRKYFKQALSDYITNYPNSPFVQKAKEELEKLNSATQSKPKAQTLDFSQAKDAKSIERAMKRVQNPSEEDKQKLIEAIRRVYPTLNAKKKRQFAKSRLMAQWLGDDRFKGLLS